MVMPPSPSLVEYEISSKPGPTEFCRKPLAVRHCGRNYFGARPSFAHSSSRVDMNLI